MKSLMQEMVELLKMVESAEVAAERLIERAYDKGFDNGVSHAKLGLVAETDQQKRDRIVKQAKEFVEEVTNEIYEGRNWTNYVDNGHMRTEFIVNKDKRTVVALLFYKYYSDGVRYKGIAKCAHNDCFNEHIGKAIALHRALGLDVPQEYLDVPNPTEVRVGNVVGLVDSLGLPYVRSIREFDDDGTVRYVCGGYDHIQQVETGKIIDDSESEPNV